MGPCGQVRLMSIDGGHTEECVLNDLRLADAALAGAGVAVIDDYFNAEWPGVSTGVAHFLVQGEGKLRPFAISPNKLYCCDLGFADFYRSRIASAAGFNPLKSSSLFGSEVDVYVGPPAPPALSVYVRERLRQSAWLPPYCERRHGLLSIRGHAGGSMSGALK